MQKKEKEKAVTKIDCEVLEYLKEVMKEKFKKKKGDRNDGKIKIPPLSRSGIAKTIF